MAASFVASDGLVNTDTFVINIIFVSGCRIVIPVSCPPGSVVVGDVPGRLQNMNSFLSCDSWGSVPPLMLGGGATRNHGHVALWD